MIHALWLNLHDPAFDLAGAATIGLLAFRRRIVNRIERGRRPETPARRARQASCVRIIHDDIIPIGRPKAARP